MEKDQTHIRHLLLFFFNKGETASSARRIICNVYGDDYVAERTCSKWFARFRSGDLSLLDEPGRGRPKKLHDDALRELVEANPDLSINALAKKLGSTHSTVYRHLLAIGKLPKSDQQMPQQLTPEEEIHQDSASTSHSPQEKPPLSVEITTEDDQYLIPLNNIKNKKLTIHNTNIGKRLWVNKKQKTPKRLAQPQNINHQNNKDIIENENV